MSDKRIHYVDHEQLDRVAALIGPYGCKINEHLIMREAMSAVSFQNAVAQESWARLTAQAATGFRP